MNTRAFTLALIIAALAALMVNTYIDDKETQITQQYGTKTTVVIAKKDIAELELIDDSKVTIKPVPKNFKMPGGFSKISEVENTVATVPIRKGEQITKPRVIFPGARTGLARQVSVGRRAVAIQITENQAVSKLLKPGDRVDVLASINYAPGRKDLQKIKTILQD
ncbi:MAG: Flp pilus assembly protein CpaB, partial [Bacteriovoracaceae bacterium]|nr:Flp pilus assembly protein CpaB [Bacteriovoracaceae bacterium]